MMNGGRQGRTEEQRGDYSAFIIPHSSFGCGVGIVDCRLFISNPGNKKAQPVFSRLGDLHADASCSIDGRCDANHNCSYFNWRAIRAMGTQVETLAAINFLIQMKECSGSRDVVSFSWFAPGGSIFSAARYNDLQTQRHS